MVLLFPGQGRKASQRKWRRAESLKDESPSERLCSRLREAENRHHTQFPVPGLAARSGSAG